MFERFSDDARRTVVRALVEARLLGHDYVGTEHTLIALAAGNGPASGALAAEGVTVDAARVAVAEVAVGDRVSSPWDDGPYTARAKHTFDLGLREAFTHGHHYIASGHLLLGILRLREGNGVRALETLGVDLDGLWQKVEEGLEAEEPVPAPTPNRSAISAGRLGIHKHQGEDAPELPPPEAVDDDPAPSRRRTCSFCRTLLGTDDRFVAAADAAICDGCVRACARVLGVSAEGVAGDDVGDPGEVAGAQRIVAAREAAGPVG